MKFRLVETYRYWWPVAVRIPHPDNPGEVLEQRFRIQFQPLGREEELASQEAYAKLRGARERAAREHDLLRRICVNWDDVVDEDGGAVAFGPEVFDRALQSAWFRNAIYAAYTESLKGEAARLGN